MPTEFTKKWLILCEGPEDQAFLCQFLQEHGIGEFQVEFAEGWSQFGERLKTFREVQTFIDNTEAVLVVTDCDDSKDQQFKKVCKKIADDSGLDVPGNPLEKTVKSDGVPQLVIVMIPLDEDTGGLERFILEAAYSKFPVEAELEEFISKMPAKNWRRNPQDKARIRSLISTTCEDDPNTSLRFLWSRKEEYHIPVKHESLDVLADFLRTFGDFLAE